MRVPPPAQYVYIHMGTEFAHISVPLAISLVAFLKRAYH